MFFFFIDGEYCLTETCVRTAADLLSSVDKSVDPCEDFYEYACGSWVRANPIPDGKSMWGTFVKLDQQNQLVVKNALRKYLPIYWLASTHVLFKDYYIK